MKHKHKTNLPVPEFPSFEEIKLPNTENILEEILALKKEAQTFVALHSSLESEKTLLIADFVGSLKEIAERLKNLDNKKILFTGSMADAGALKALCPTKTILFLEDNHLFHKEKGILEKIYLTLKYQLPYADLIDNSLFE